MRRMEKNEKSGEEEGILPSLVQKSGVIFQELPTPDRSDRRWATGLNSNNKSRTYRVLAPLWYWVDIFRNADVGYFLRHGGVRCHRSSLRDPGCEIFLIRSTELMPVKWDEVGGPWVEIKTVELARDYTKSMRRFQLLQPQFAEAQKTYSERASVVSRLLDGWIELILNTKRAQMQGDDVISPWSVGTTEWMPVVCWIRRQNQGGGGECP